jgi:hypothetical protein
MALGRLFFRPTAASGMRLPQGNQNIDAQRLHSIEQAIIAAVVSAQAEERAISRRLREAGDRLSMGAGAEHKGPLERDRPGKPNLTTPEKEFSAAAKRLHQLTAHIRHLQRLLDELRRP